MKKVVLIALFAVPVAFSAQTKDGAAVTAPAKKESQGTPAPESPQAVIAELIITENTGGGTTMRFDVGKSQPSYFSDKELVQQLAEMRGYQVYNVPDAMSYLLSVGFRYIDTYQVTLKERSETHLIFQKDVRRTKESGDATKPAATTRPPASNPRVNAPTPQKK